MKTILKNAGYVFMILLLVMTFSCSSEDGAQGPAGLDGTNGQDGADGNANVQTFNFDTSLLIGSHWILDWSELTVDNIDNDVILVYIYSRFGTLYSVPGLLENANQEVRFYISPEFPNDLDIRFKNPIDNTNVTVTGTQYPRVRTVLIEPTSTTSAKNGDKVSGKAAIYAELANAGVDINDYNAVAAYYGLEDKN